MAIFGGFGGWLRAPVVRNTDGSINHTERGIFVLLGLAGVALVIVVLNSAAMLWVSPSAAGRFLIWAWLTALAAWLVGILLGLLFGLPSVEVRTAPPSVGPGGERISAGLGYRDSTNLEQVADWVTKILIGLTLTQYDRWEQAFEQAFARVGAQMFGCQPALVCVDAAPAAIVAVGFAANGFLVSYLLMRRYFITEMIYGKVEAENAGKLIDAARQAGLLQESSVTRSAETSRSDTVAIATTAASLAPSQSSDKADALVRTVVQGIDFPDDPWRGKFGKTNIGRDCRLDATVSPLSGSNELFNVRLIVSSDAVANRAGQTATFYLHPTFGNEPKKVAFGQDGTATLELIAYGAFTVGVMLEKGEQLELNLATVSGAPDLFKLR